MMEEKVFAAENGNEIAPLYANVVLALKQVYDPEIPVNVYDLGLIYELSIDDKKIVHIKMTFTAPNCPMADMVMQDVRNGVLDVPGVQGCEIEFVFEPPWDQSLLSDEARIALGLDLEFDSEGEEE